MYSRHKKRRPRWNERDQLLFKIRTPIVTLNFEGTKIVPFFFDPLVIEYTSSICTSILIVSGGKKGWRREWTWKIFPVSSSEITSDRKYLFSN